MTLILFLCFCFINSQVVAIKIQEFTVKNLGSVVLEVKSDLSATNISRFVWSHNANLVVISENKHEIISVGSFEKRIKNHVIADDGTVKLEIFPFKRSDFGVWYFAASNNKYKDEIFVKVKPPQVQLLQSLKIDMGDTFSITCPGESWNLTLENKIIAQGNDKITFTVPIFEFEKKATFACGKCQTSECLVTSIRELFFVVPKFFSLLWWYQRLYLVWLEPFVLFFKINSIFC